MTTMSPTQVDALWLAVDDQRTRTADLLEELEPAQWLHPSLCEGWRVRHVAAHLTLQQQGFGDILSFTAGHPTLLRSVGLNRTIRDSAVLHADDLTDGEVIARIRGMVGSRRHNVFVTPLETLTDILVHGQDIAIPLGVDLTMDPYGSALAATRRWDTRRSWQSLVFRKTPLGGVRFTATDTDWARGEGPEVAGPMGALLLVLCGRRAGLAQCSGTGVDALRDALA